MSCPFLLWVWLRGELEAMFLQSSLPIHDFTYDAVIHNRDLTPDLLMAKSLVLDLSDLVIDLFV
jgi:hypothetical protein